MLIYIKKMGMLLIIYILHIGSTCYVSLDWLDNCASSMHGNCAQNYLNSWLICSNIMYVCRLLEMILMLPQGSSSLHSLFSRDNSLLQWQYWIPGNIWCIDTCTRISSCIDTYILNTIVLLSLTLLELYTITQSRDCS